MEGEVDDRWMGKDVLLLEIGSETTRGRAQTCMRWMDGRGVTTGRGVRMGS